MLGYVFGCYALGDVFSMNFELNAYTWGLDVGCLLIKFSCGI